MEHIFVIGLGQPMIDLIIEVSEEILEEHSLEKNNAIRVQESHNSLFSEIRKDDNTKYVPGGSTTNTLRIASKLLKRSNQNVGCIGSVGNDAEGEIYEEMMASEGVIGFYEYCDKPTAQCLVLVNGKNRSLVTNIGAANSLTQNILDTEICNKALNSAEIFYIAGFSLSLEKYVVQRFVEASKNKTLVLNLSAPFVCEKFCDIINPIIGQADFVIGNESEVNAFVKSREFNQEEDDEVKAKYLSSKFFTKNSNQTLIVTRGENSILLMTGNTLDKIEVPKIDVRDIKDTNGAGDAFVGGFISKLAEGKNKRECIEYGIEIAQLVLRQVGCILPEIDACNRI